MAQNSSIGDFVWSDYNANGIQDIGEPGLADVFVMLTDCSGNWKGQTTSDANGAYQFSNLAAGSYKIKFIALNATVAPTHAGNDGALDNDVNQGWTGFTDCFTLAAGENKTDIDAGFVLDSPGACDNLTSGGTISGTQTICAGESAASLNSTSLPTGGSGAIEYIWLSKVGSACPNNVNLAIAGATNASYGPGVLTQTTTFRRCARRLGCTDWTSGESNCITVTVDESPTCGGGNTSASVGDKVWSDTNGNGIQEAGEVGLSGVFIMLTDCAGNWKGQTTSDANGKYIFSNIMPGDYKIKFVVPNATVSPTHAGNNTNADSDVSQGWTGFTACFTVQLGQHRIDIDAGFVPQNGTGCDAPISASITNVQCNGHSTPSANDDTYTFDLTVNSGADWGWSGGGATVTTSNAHSPHTFGPYAISNGAVNFSIVDADNNLCTFEVNVNAPAPCSGGTGNGSIGDFVWNDNNGNGIQDIGESGRADVFVMLTDCAGNWKGQTTTSATGAYSFTDVPPGGYKIKFVSLNAKLSPTHAGSNPNLDSDVNQGWTGFTDCFTLAAGENKTDIDAGFVPNGTPVISVLDPNTQQKFVNPLPIPAVITPSYGNHYDVSIEQFTHDAGLVDPVTGNSLMTTMWGYNGMFPGPTFQVNAYQPITVTWDNNLRINGQNLPHILPVDETIHWARPTGYPGSGVPIVTHLHGGHTEASSDGYPDAWYTPSLGQTGSQYIKKTYTFDNTQESTLLWYHDHAVGITRLNVYAGLAGAYIVRDNWENSLNLPQGSYEVPLIIGDKSFKTDGSLYYPSKSTDPNHPDPTVLPEMYGDMILVNGKVWPVLDVEPRKYRFRVLNASDSRFYHVALSNGMPMTQIGSDGGFLDAPLALTDFLLAPAERYDLVIDFSDPAYWGQTIVMTNDANSPYPDGDPVDAPNAGKIMAFRVNKPLQGADNSTVPQSLRPGVLPTPPAPVRTRQLTLNEGMDNIGRLKPILGTVENGVLNWTDPITENPQINEPEIWEIINTTGDAHPIHLHQIFFQVLDHQAYDVATFTSTGNIVRLGQPTVETKEFKDTYVVMPGEIARFAVNFDLPGLYVWHCHILSHEDFDMMRPMYIGDCTQPTNTPTPLTFMNCGSTAQDDLGDYVWNDANGNGVQDNSETGLGNVFVMLTDCSGAWMDQTVTDANGYYAFNNLASGDYKVKFAAPLGYTVAPTHVGTNANIDNDVNQGWLGLTDCITFQAGQAIDNIDAGFKPTSQGYVSNAFLNLNLGQNLYTAELQWENNTSDIIDYYIVQRSDGEHYKTIAQIEGDAKASIFEFTDFEPVLGRNDYRIIGMTFHGNSIISNEVSGFFEQRNNVQLYPNPATEYFELDLMPFKGQSVDITVSNPVGIVAKSAKVPMVGDEPVIMQLDGVKNGFYQVTIKAEHGQMITKKLVVERL